MSIDFNAVFGAKTPTNTNATGQKTGKDGKPLVPANFWLNVGFSTEVEVEGVRETRFVSLPVGIPLDNQERLATNSRNQVFAAFQAARNNLLDQVLEVCKTLQPGEEKVIGEASGLQIQVRRINAEVEAVAPELNPFAKKLNLAALAIAA